MRRWHTVTPTSTALLDDAGYAPAAAESIQALATPSRLRILARLHGGPASVSELADAVCMEASAVSHQLRVLRHLGLVVGERRGAQVDLRAARRSRRRAA